MKKPKHFGWKFDGTQYVATITDNPIAPNTMISYASCNCEGNIFTCICGVAIYTSLKLGKVLIRTYWYFPKIS